MGFPVVQGYRPARLKVIWSGTSYHNTVYAPDTAQVKIDLQYQIGGDEWISFEDFPRMGPPNFDFDKETAEALLSATQDLAVLKVRAELEVGMTYCSSSSPCLRTSTLWGDIAIWDIYVELERITIVTPTGGGPAFPYQNCNWAMSKPIEMTGSMNTAFSGPRVLGNAAVEGLSTDMTAAITIDGTYLPTQALDCQVTAAQVLSGRIAYPQGQAYTLMHENPQCDNYPPRLWPPHPTSSWWISEELWNSNPSIANAIVSAGGYYWTALGEGPLGQTNDLKYTEMRTPEGPDVGIYPDFGLPPTTRADFSVTYRRMRLNVVNFSHYTDGQWQAVVSHELGHAIGFDHANTIEWAKTIMVAPGGYFDQEGLLPRTLEKCGTVMAFPVNIQR